ncbi:glutathione S-transferase 1 [Ditylenchus destructor]|nr:glutathione S-transferase 1 [Ditylenchus destructor]
MQILKDTRMNRKSDEIFKETYKPAVEGHFPRLVKLLADSGSGFYGKSGVSWIDFFLASEFITTKNLAPELMKSYPELQKHCDRVHALPQLQSYFAKRKETLL